MHDEQEPTLLSVEKGGSWRSSWGKQVIEAESSSCILGPNSYNVLNSKDVPRSSQTFESMPKIQFPLFQR